MQLKNCRVNEKSKWFGCVKSQCAALCISIRKVSDKRCRAVSLFGLFHSTATAEIPFIIPQVSHHAFRMALLRSEIRKGLQRLCLRADVELAKRTRSQVAPQRGTSSRAFCGSQKLCTAFIGCQVLGTDSYLSLRSPERGRLATSAFAAVGCV